MSKLFFIFMIFLAIKIPASGQNFNWSAGFDGFLDNREYYSINDPQTFFGSRIWGELGADINSMHRFRAGMNYLYEFGHDPKAYFPNITMYYQYDNGKVDFRIGAFPRRHLLQYPLAFLADTLLYYRPNIEGTYLGYRGTWGHQIVFIDWTSRQTDINPERFMFGFSGNLHKGIFFLDHYFLMSHLAGKGIREPGFHLRDNGGLNVSLGVDLSQITFLDSLSFRAGSLVSLDRIRGVDDGWQTPAGFMGQFDAFYRNMGITGLLYTGKGHFFFYGDPFYQLGQYGRLDLYYSPFHNRKVNLKIDFVLHFAKSQIDYSQQILLSVALNGKQPGTPAEGSLP